MERIGILVGNELPDGALLVVAGHDVDAQHLDAGLSQPLVLKDILADAALIRRPAIVGLLQRHASHLEAHALVVAFLHDGEDGAVARLHTIVAMGAVEGTGEAVGAVLADEGAVHGQVVLSPCGQSGDGRQQHREKKTLHFFLFFRWSIKSMT